MSFTRSSPVLRQSLSIAARLRASTPAPAPTLRQHFSIYSIAAKGGGMKIRSSDPNMLLALGSASTGSSAARQSWCALHSKESRGFASRPDPNADARDKVKAARRIVIKVGTAVVTNKATGQVAISRIGQLVEEIRNLHQDGKQILLVSSGAVGLGRSQLGFTVQETDESEQGMVNRQASAASGQALLMGMYTAMMQSMGLKCAQVLITQHDFTCPQRYERLTDTLARLASLDIIPIINENDVVTGGAGELDSDSAFSDNDMLSALVAAGVGADAVAMMTDVDAVFDKPPTEPGAKRIALYDESQAVQIGAKSVGGRGGMASKILAAQTAAAGGVHAIVANGIDLSNITAIFNSEDVGTLFPAIEMRPTKLQHWLAHAATSATLKGSVTISEAAARRVSSGMTRFPLRSDDVTATSGVLGSSDPIEILDQDGNSIGRGMVSACPDAPSHGDLPVKGFKDVVRTSLQDQV